VGFDRTCLDNREPAFGFDGTEEQAIVSGQQDAAHHAIVALPARAGLYAKRARTHEVVRLRPMSRNWVFLVALLALSPCSAQAHDIYEDLVDASGYRCCDNDDCHPVPYRMSPRGEVQMLVEQHWIDIPKETIQYRALPGDTGETAGGHWCGAPYRELNGYYTRCAILPPNAALLLGHEPREVTLSGGR
jgi:hypothetical protein